MSINRQIILWTLLTFVFSWPVWFLSGVLTRGEGFAYDARWLIAQCGVFGPSVAALILSCIQSRKMPVKGLRVLVLYVVIFAAGIVIASGAPASAGDLTLLQAIVVTAIGAASIAFFLPWKNGLLPVTGSGGPPGKTGSRMIPLAIFGLPALFLVSWAIVNAPGNRFALASFEKGLPSFTGLLFTAFFMNLVYGGSMGEELGWRGFALPLLLRKYSAVRASLILGIIWACWHLPVDLSAASAPAAAAAVIFRVVWTLPLAVVFTWFYMYSGGSLLIALLLHTSVNILPDLGFSRYEYSMFLLSFLLVITAIVLSRTRLMRSKA